MVRLSIRRRESALPLVRLLTLTGSSTVSLKHALQNMLSSSLSGHSSLASASREPSARTTPRLKTDFYAPSGHARALRQILRNLDRSPQLGRLGLIRSIFTGKFTRSSKTINFKRSSKSLTFRPPSTLKPSRFVLQNAAATIVLYMTH